jgi:hypothetical protein
MPDEDDRAEGQAGSSARAEHDRRKTKREAAVREAHPRTAGVRLALGSAPRHESNWASGAQGEELVAAWLAKHCPGASAMHDRRMPGTRGNIDHIAVAPSGVWVIDTKRYKGRVEVSKPLFGSPRLLIAGRDKTSLVDGLARQVSAVTAALSASAGGPPVHGCFCFVDSELPLIGTLSINGFLVLGRRSLAKRLNANGPLDTSAISLIVETLTSAFPAK